mmetsp:Transcript_10854/g.13105  ORF Transcript_10854/g.13105 Transcript_10854/m.13105 type:complete len:864 (+) Transcript_10854:149-2740(+)
MIGFDELVHPLAVEFAFGVFVLFILRNFLFTSVSKEVELEIGGNLSYIVEEENSREAVSNRLASPLRKGKDRVDSKGVKQVSTQRTTPFVSTGSDFVHDAGSEGTESTEAISYDDEDKYLHHDYQESGLDTDHLDEHQVEDVLSPLKSLHAIWTEECRNKRKRDTSTYMFQKRPSFIVLSYLDPIDVGKCRAASLDFWGWICRKTDGSYSNSTCKSPKKGSCNVDASILNSLSEPESCLESVVSILSSCSYEKFLEADEELPFCDIVDLCSKMIHLALIKMRPDYALMIYNIILQGARNESKDLAATSIAWSDSHLNTAKLHRDIYLFLYNLVIQSLFTLSSDGKLSCKGGVVRQYMGVINMINSRNMAAAKKKSGGARSLLQWVDTQDVDSSKFQFFDKIPSLNFCNRILSFFETVSEQYQMIGEHFRFISTTLPMLVRCQQQTISWAVSKAHLSITHHEQNSKSPRKSTSKDKSAKAVGKIRNTDPDRQSKVRSEPRVLDSNVSKSAKIHCTSKHTQNTESINESSNAAAKMSTAEQNHKVHKVKPERRTAHSKHVPKVRDEPKKGRKSKAECGNDLQLKTPTKILQRKTGSDRSIESHGTPESQHEKFPWGGYPQEGLSKRRSVSLDTSSMSENAAVRGGIVSNNPGSKYAPGQSGKGVGKNSHRGRRRADSSSPRNYSSSRKNNRYKSTKAGNKSNFGQHSGKGKSKRGKPHGGQQNQRRKPTSGPSKGQRKQNNSRKPQLRINTNLLTGSAMNVMAAPFVPNSAKSSSSNVDADVVTHAGGVSHNRGDAAASSKVYGMFNSYVQSPFPSESWSPASDSQSRRPSDTKIMNNSSSDGLKRLDSVGEIDFASRVDLSFLD